MKKQNLVLLAIVGLVVSVSLSFRSFHVYYLALFTNRNKFEHSFLEYVSTQGKVLWKYLELLIAPLKWSFWHDPGLNHNLNFLSWLPLIGILILAAAVLFYFYKKQNWFAVFSFLAVICPYFLKQSTQENC